MARLSLLFLCTILLISSAGCRTSGFGNQPMFGQQTFGQFNQSPVSQGAYNPNVNGGQYGNQQMPTIREFGRNIGNRILNGVINRGIGGALNGIF